jgi:hypothetical protein
MVSPVADPKSRNFKLRAGSNTGHACVIPEFPGRDAPLPLPCPEWWEKVSPLSYDFEGTPRPSVDQGLLPGAYATTG